MGRSINDFRASLDTDLARPARFDVEIPVPIKLMRYQGTARKLSFRCESAQLPSRTLSTIERKIYGPTEKMASGTIYNDLQLTFAVSDDMKEKTFFDEWMELIHPKTSYDMVYREDYITPVTINQYGVDNQLTYSTTLIDAFPISVNQLDLDWSNENSYHKLTVVFAYYRWEGNSIRSLVSGVVDTAIGAAVDVVTDKLMSMASGLKKDGNPSDSSPIYDMKKIGGKFK